MSAFSDLTASEARTLVSKLRLESGDNISPFLVSAEDVEILYDAKEGDYPKTVVATILLLIDRLSAERERQGDKASEAMLERRIKALCDDKLPFWEKQAGVMNGGMTTRTLDTGIDSYDATLWS